MSQKAIREHDGKLILSKYLAQSGISLSCRSVQVTPATNLSLLPTLPGNEWLSTTPLVVKPDQLIKRRGKAGLIGLNLTYPQVIEWLSTRRNQPHTIGDTTGILDTFIIEPFLPHAQEDEYYVCIYSTATGDVILFSHEGGVDIGDVDSKASKFIAPLELTFDEDTTSALSTTLLSNVPADRKSTVLDFIVHLLILYQSLNFAYLEINPLVYNTTTKSLAILDLAAKLDETAAFLSNKQWVAACPHYGSEMQFPAPFGRTLIKEEAYIRELDGKTGASLKLTVLNPSGRVWSLIAGGGASVVYADTVADLGFAHELANYGEYSGAPTTEFTRLYASTVFDLMTREENNLNLHPDGKILLIGGAIANFTDIAATFKGIIIALREYATLFKKYNIKTYIRRAGPNYQEGLRLMRQEATQLDLPIFVYGPEIPMTKIITIALGVDENNYTPRYVTPQPHYVNGLGLNNLQKDNMSPFSNIDFEKYPKIRYLPRRPSLVSPSSDSWKPLFTPNTQAIVYGLQTTAVQNMLDFDFINGRTAPSVKAIVYPFKGNHYQKFYWNDKEILIPCLQQLSEAMQKYPEVSVVVNFASFRSVYDSVLEQMKYPNIATIAIIAEGVPERQSRLLAYAAAQKNIILIGPATVGGISVGGAFRIGNAGGALDNIIASKLYRPGSVAYVTRSGGLSNELNNLLAQNTNGVYEGIAIGGDKYPGSGFVEHISRYQNDPNVAMIVLIGEVGGSTEYEIVKLLEEKKITKPLIAWCIGTVASAITGGNDVQFGHAGACSGGNDAESATAKNAALKAAGAFVPTSFEGLGQMLNTVYAGLVEDGIIPLYEEQPPPVLPVDYKWAQQLGLIRKPAHFISTISDERGQELKYAGVGICEVMGNPDIGLGGVIGLLWFKKKLPSYFSQFLEKVLMLTADHGPAVSGAHNTIVAARAGKDLVSSVASGMLTIGPSFGGAINDAAKQFYAAYSQKQTPEDFINTMRDSKKLISGIGHLVKSVENPDSRCVQLKQFIDETILPQLSLRYGNNVTGLPLVDYALAVEKLTTKKKSSLILNVDGYIAVTMVSLWLAHPDLFSPDEVNEYIDMGILNGFFVLGRSIGLIGHWVDQNRLKQGLYRHPADDILIHNPDW